MPNGTVPPVQQKTSSRSLEVAENAAIKKSAGNGVVISVVLLVAVLAIAVYFYI